MIVSPLVPTTMIVSPLVPTTMIVSPLAPMTMIVSPLVPTTMITNSFPVHGTERLLDSGKATPTAPDAPNGHVATPIGGISSPASIGSRKSSLIGVPKSSPVIGSKQSSAIGAPSSSPVIGSAAVVEPGKVISTSSLASVKFAPLPAELHRTLRFKKGAQPLGVDLDVSGGWAIITGVVPGGAVDKLNRERPTCSDSMRGVGGLDGLASAVLGPEDPNVVMTAAGSRIQDNLIKVGDVLISINGEPVGGLDEAGVREVLTHVGVGEVSLVFVPREDAEVFHHTHQLLGEHQRQIK
ncbi:hypothetical protein HAZT_HAZT004052 [Hyalella azteca]|uniref:PDZ domain-containing protein n=1 Tax=Hyalella azteca TaxID=294128 RepID=A0A6A0GZI5_HYAAZ|nr:hypothetical protein HAZT_HAZT004052 [Hyalella azteca]